MSNRIVICVSLFVLFVFWLGGCGGGGVNGASSQNPLTAEEVAQINQASSAITDVLDNFTDSHGAEAFEAGRQAALQQANVTNATVSDGTLIVRYRNGGSELWVQEMPEFIPPADMDEFQAFVRTIKQQARSRTSVGTRKAVIINALYDDPGWDLLEQTFDDMEQVLEAVGFTVTRLDGTGASVQALRGLQENSVIVQLGHGGLSDGVLINTPYAVQTGQYWTIDQGFSSDWRDGRIAKMNVGWGADHQGEKAFVAVTGNFWLDAYVGNHFTKVLFFNLACSSSKYSSYRDNLFSVGIVGYTGWSEPQGRSPWQAYRQLALMAGGKSFGEARDALPTWYTHQDRNNDADSDLWCGPADGLNLKLSDTETRPVTILIDAPRPNDGSLTQRVVSVEGTIQPWPTAYRRLNINVNGESTSCTPDPDTGAFQQNVGVRSGANVITASLLTDQGEYSQTITMNANLPTNVLYSRLWWSTDLNDIDFHLKPVAVPGYTNECYFGNKKPSWGASLDVDDMYGFGPEHITAENLPAGRYLLYVHYFATHEQTQTAQVSIAVGTYGNTPRIYSMPGGMSAAQQVWNVCYIDYPSGQITLLNQITTRAGSQLPLQMAK